MKNLALFILAASLAVAQSVNVQKTSGTNALTGSLVVGDGKTLTATGTGTIVATSAASVSGNVTVGAGSTLTVNGVMTGTPTSGALSLANLTLTLPTSPTFAGVWTGAQGGTGVANTGKTITLGGNVTTVGAFNLGISLSGNTSVSFPTTGTLATLAGSETFTNKSISLGSNTLTGTSAQLATAISDETGSGALVFGTSPTLTTPVLGVATATSVTGATDLTLAGGSSGASLVLGALSAGNANATITPKGAGLFAVVGATAINNVTASSVPLILTGDGGIGSTQTIRFSTIGYGDRGTEITSIRPGGSFATNLTFSTNSGGSGTAIVEGMRLTGAQNLLIGTTTDMSGSGGLSVAGKLGVNGGVSSLGTNISAAFASPPNGPATKIYSNQAADMAGTAGIEATSYGSSKFHGFIVNNTGAGIYGNSSATTALFAYASGSNPIAFGSISANPFTNASVTATEWARFSGTGNLLLNTTTDMASTAGGLTVAATGSGATATAVNTGGLRSANFGLSTVSGGASYFGGQITGTVNAATGVSTIAAHAAANPRISIKKGNATANQGLWDIEGSTDGVLLFRAVNDADSAASNWMSIARTGVTPTSVNILTTTSASSSTVGALTIGNGTAATNVAIGGGNVYAGANLFTNGGASVLGDYSGDNYLRIASLSTGIGGLKFRPTASDTNTYGFTLQYNGTANNFAILRHEFSTAGTNALTIARASGDVALASSSSSIGVGTGALQVAGGIYAGAASVFGGLVSVGGSTPASAAATGVAGTITWDASYIYICTATNTWKRAAIATW
jgi:hypothetical protein